MIGRGHRVTLIAPPESRIFPVSKDFGVESVALPIAHKNWRGLSALRSWFAANRPDVVNTHSSTDSWLAALSCKAPIVRTRHISAPVGAHPWNRWLYRSAARRVVTTGEALRRHLIDTLGMEEKHVVSVPTGIDLSRFRKTAAIRGALGIPATAFVFGIVATLRSWKGHEYLLDAFSTLQGDFHLLIAGDGPQRPVLEKRIAAEEKRSKIHLVGQREDIPEIMSSMDCFVLPSYANEGVPQAIMQAMAAELPVISTQVGAIDEAVIDGETGVLVPPRNPQALAAAMLEMYRLPEMRVEMGRKARLVAEQKFSLEKMLDAMERVFLSVQ